MPKTIAVTNFSGNTGKSMLASHVLGPRLSATVIRVETINSSNGMEAVELDARRLVEVGKMISGSIDNLVIDIGSSNVESVLRQLSKELNGLQHDIDAWVLPVTPDLKQQKDTVQCIRALTDLGVDAERIVVVPNQVDDVRFDADFRGLTAQLKAIGVSLSSPVFHADIMSRLVDKPIQFVACEDPKFLRDECRKAKAVGDDENADFIASMRMDVFAAREVLKNLDDVWRSLPSFITA